MDDRETLTWGTAPHLAVTVLGGILRGLSGGIVGMFVGGLWLSTYSRPETPWWALALALVFFLGGGVLGVRFGRGRVHTLVFTRQGVRMVNRLGAFEVNAADVMVVEVEHRSSSLDERGKSRDDYGWGMSRVHYDTTTLWLACKDVNPVTIRGQYNPQLATSLARLLGPGVEIRDRHVPRKATPSA